MITQNDPRRWKERADGSVISEDHSGIANLSPNVTMKEVKSVPIDPHNGNIPAYGLLRQGYEGQGKPSMELAFFSAVMKKGRAV